MCEYQQSLFQRKGQRMLLWLCMLLALVFGCVGANAQATQGSVIGTVKDPNGSVVANAAVTLTNTDEGTQRISRTDCTGVYKFLDV